MAAGGADEGGDVGGGGRVEDGERRGDGGVAEVGGEGVGSGGEEGEGRGGRGEREVDGRDKDEAVEEEEEEVVVVEVVGEGWHGWLFYGRFGMGVDGDVVFIYMGRRETGV